MVRCSFCGAALIAMALALAAMAQVVLRSAAPPTSRISQQQKSMLSPSARAAAAAAAADKDIYNSMPKLLSVPPPPPAVSSASAGGEAQCTGGPRFEHLQLNEPARKLWQCSGAVSEASVRAVFLTFGSSSMKDFAEPTESASHGHAQPRLTRGERRTPNVFEG